MRMDQRRKQAFMQLSVLRRRNAVARPVAGTRHEFEKISSVGSHCISMYVIRLAQAEEGKFVQ